MPGSNLNLNILNMNAYIKCDEIPFVCSKDIERNGRSENFDINQGRNSVTNLQILPGNNLNLDLVNIDTYKKGSSVATPFGVSFQFLQRVVNFS